MLGAIIGDMVGSIYEFHPIKTKNFNIYNPRMRMTDDSYLTIAVMKALMKNYPIKYDKESLKKLQSDLTKEFINTWKEHLTCGFGHMFYEWCLKASEGSIKPYNSYGNGSAMRISPVAYVVNSEDELKLLCKTITEITHNHPEGMKGAEAIALCIYMALHGSTKEEIKQKMMKEYYPEIQNFDFENLIKTYRFREICQESCPQAIYCFLISNSLEDTLRNCVAIGGDCDTTGAMAGAIAQAYYNKERPCEFEKNFTYLMIDPEVEKIVNKFHQTISK